MSNTTITVTPDQLQAIVAAAVAQAVAELAPAQSEVPAKADPAPAKDSGFVTWLRDSAEARHARKESNAELAAWMRSKGLHPGGQAWTAAKAGERGVAKLRKLNKADEAARAAN